MTERIDLRLISGLADERIVWRHAAVISQPNDFATVILCVLRALLLLPFPDRQIQKVGTIERDAATIVRVRLAPRVGDEDVLDVGERGPIESAARQCRRREIVVARLRVGQIDEAILRERRMQRDVEQTAKHTREDFGDAGNRCWIEHAVADDAQTALALGGEHRSIGKKREAPRMRESSRHWHDANWRLATEERLRQWRC